MNDAEIEQRETELQQRIDTLNSEIEEAERLISTYRDAVEITVALPSNNALLPRAALRFSDDPSGHVSGTDGPEASPVIAVVLSILADRVMRMKKELTDLGVIEQEIAGPSPRPNDANDADELQKLASLELAERLDTLRKSGNTILDMPIDIPLEARSGAKPRARMKR